MPGGGGGGGHDEVDDDYVPPARRGVLFFSAIPRDMRPQEVRMHFSEFGTILRQKFTPFPKKERRPGGPLLPLQFRSGYLEFAHAADARRAAAAMNGTSVACKRRRKCHGQLWTVKFLDNFSWDTLLEEREGALRTRRQREAEARSTERAINEAYRAAVLAKGRRKRPRAEAAAAAEGKPPEPDGPARVERRERRTAARASSASASASAAAASAGDTSLEAGRKRRKGQR
ncbi:ESF2/ABP1 family protein [Trypanosoma conorhini]|uniref:ESF2/ABP1 family protein n=1 Tax=Trypanosoma conorhini TaxID=83891 RepID=A0A422PGK8_9TRYP|nr:ESF2/ABP1 family protein [Trypanosoma conorhini]RNF16823.1 ESF2/ABP1 family protein [Trypanosoma conorhini]